MACVKNMRANDMHPDTPSQGWLLLFVQSGQEAHVAEQLRAVGLEVLLPLHQTGTNPAASEPLFPRYLFVRASNALNWAQLRSIAGVRNVVDLGPERSPQRVCADDWVQSITRRLSRQLRHVDNGTQRSIELLMACSAPPPPKELIAAPNSSRNSPSIE
jgi:transcription antitermination factor NusG